MQRALIAIVVMTYLSGCSVVYMPHADGPSPDQFPECTEDTVTAFADAAVATGALVGVVAAGASAAYGADDGTAALVAVGNAVAAAAFGYSAYRGYGWAQQCREATGEWIAARAGRAAALAVRASPAPDVRARSPGASVVCFRTLGLDGTKAEQCLPTMDACVSAHAAAAARTDLYQRISDCAAR